MLFESASLSWHDGDGALTEISLGHKQITSEIQDCFMCIVALPPPCKNGDFSYWMYVLLCVPVKGCVDQVWTKCFLPMEQSFKLKISLIIPLAPIYTKCHDFLNFSCHFLGAVLPAPVLCLCLMWGWVCVCVFDASM